MKKKWIFTLTFSLVLLNFNIYAKSKKPFNKFKSKTNFNTPKKVTKSKATTSKKDIFGRSENSNNIKTGPEAKKLVQLNPETGFGPEVIESFNFPNTSLIELTNTMQKLTGINLIYEKDIKGKKVSIIAPSPITVGDAWKAYLSALNIAGYSLIKSGKFYKIVSNRNIRYSATKIYTGTYTPDTDNYVMRIIPLKYINSTEVSRNFRPFMTRYGRITDIKQTNTILAQDTGTNILRLVKLIQFVDIPGHEESLQIMPVQYSSAQEIAKLLGEILQTKSSKIKSRTSRSRSKDGVNISKIIAEPRTNSIIAMANAEGANQLRNLIKKLDVKDVSAGGQIHVYYLKHSDSEDLSKTLSSLVGSTGTRKSKSRFTRSSSTSNSLFNAEVKITSDKSNNAIVVTASPTDYLIIKKIIEKLDIQRDQVYVEGLIMENELSDGSQWGMTWVGAYGTGDTERVGYGGDNAGSLANLLAGNLTSIGGLFTGVGAGKKIELSMPDGSTKSVRSVTGLLTAIATNNNTNVLATPQILALDNEEAVFEVGQKIPTPKTTNTAAGSTQTSVEYNDVGLTLKITPQINKVSRFIKLKIQYSMEDFSSMKLPADLATIGIATNSRSIDTSVIVRDMDTISMGGLMRDKEVISDSKVPLLGDIPVLGWLFRSSRKEKTKTNLLFFLTPKILSSYEDTAAKHLKDTMNRRAAHLKDIVGDDDPFHTTSKGLYEKAEKQDKGPLYKQKNKFQDKTIKSDDDLEMQNFEHDELSTLYEIPNYKEIVQDVKNSNSSTKKN